MTKTATTRAKDVSVQRPPGPKRSFLPGGHLFAFRRDSLQFLTRVAREHGDISYFRLANQHVYLVNHPDLLRDILVAHADNFIKGRALQRAKRLLGEGLLTSEGEHHRRQRRLVLPAFHRQRIAGYADVMAQQTHILRERLHDGATVDMHQEMMRLTLSIVGKTLFDADVEEDADEVGATLTEILSMFQLLMLPYSELFENLPIPAVRRFNKLRAKLDTLIYRIIEERRRTKEDRGDLLSMLLLAQEEDAGEDSQSTSPSKSTLAMGAHVSAMSDEQVRDEAMTLFLAGHETTANALVWAFYLLAQNPEAEAKMHAEIDRMVGADRLPTAEDFPKLVYTEMVFAEAMRLFPPAWILGRLVLKDYQLRDYTVPAGSLILMSQYVMHRDARYYDEPEKFVPERWTAEERAKRPAFSYFPFGGGTRRCIGEGFAWTEGVLVIATLAARLRFRLVDAKQVEPKPHITLRPKRGVMMTVGKR